MSSAALIGMREKAASRRRTLSKMNKNKNPSKSKPKPVVHLKGNSTMKTGNNNGKSPNKPSNAAKVSDRVGNAIKTRKAMQNAVAAAASKRQSVVTVAVPKNNPGLLAHIKRLLGMNSGR